MTPASTGLATGRRPSRAVCAVLLGLTLALGAAPALAQGADLPAKAPAAPADPDVDLRKTIARLDARIAEAEADLTRGREARTAALTAARTEQEALAREIVDLELQSRRLAKEARSAEARAEAIDAEADRLLRTAGALVRATEQLAEQLSLYVRELPGAPAPLEALTEAALAMLDGPRSPLSSEADTSARLAERLPALDATLRAFAAVRKTAGRVTLHAGTLRAPDGSAAKATLLSIGHVGSLARTADGDVYVALRAPLDASGFRWRRPGVETRAAIERAVDQLSQTAASTEASPLLVPLDVTGRLRASSLSTPSTLRDRVTQGGPVMVPLALLALAALGIALERALFFFREARRGRGVKAELPRLLEDGAYDAATRLCGESQSVLGRVVAAAIERRGAGAAAALEAVEERLLHEEPRIERRLRALSLLGSIAPLLGLLGTVTGIIRTFGVLSGGTGGRSVVLAGGVAEALVTTAAGLAIAIPVLLTHGLLRGRADALVADVEGHAASAVLALRGRAAAESGAASGVGSDAGEAQRSGAALKPAELRPT